MDLKEYRIDLKVRNNLILNKIEELGFKSIPDFCKVYEIGYVTLLNIIAMKRSLFDQHGKFRPIIYQLCDVFMCAPDDLFTQAQMQAQLATNKATLQVNEAEAKFLMQSSETLSLDDQAETDDKSKLIYQALESLTPREQKIIKARFGLEEGEKTLDEVAKLENVSRERIRQIERKAIRKMRDPRRTPELKYYSQLD